MKKVDEWGHAKTSIETLKVELSGIFSIVFMFTDTIIGPIPSKAAMLLTITVGPLFEQGI